MRNYLSALAFSFLGLAACAQENTPFRQATPLHEGAVFPAKYKAQVSDTLTIMTWNIEHFIDEHDDIYVNNRREDEARIDESKLSLVAKVLQMADADVVVLQEAESANWVEAFVEEYLKDFNYPFISDARSRDWYQNVVILSRVPIGVMRSYGNIHTPVEFTEDSVAKYQTQDYINTRMWTCDLLVNAEYALFLTGMHLKAGPGPRNEAMRLGQINFIKGQLEQLNRLYRKANLMVLGDLNAYPESVEITRLKESGKRAVQLIDPLSADTYSHPADQPSRRLDYILYNRHLEKEIVAGSAQIFTPYEAATMRQASDHLPVIIKLLTKEQ
jgi:endonuclease/exonuclease/phosphatase family metal-dependent hydrolase